MAARRLAPDNAETDLARKLRLEGRLRVRLRALNSAFLQQYEARLASSGLLLDAGPLEAATETILRDHAGAVQRGFQNRLRLRMPPGLGANTAESLLIETTLSDFSLARARAEAARITGTTRRAMARALEVVERDAAGAALTGAERANRATSLLRRNLAARADLIAANETQVVAEASKFTEAEVLSGREPTLRPGTPNQGPAAFGKRWDSQGDSVVRPTHLSADSQLVAADQPFVVGGFQLRYPGDSSLGAPARETMNCRCSSHYDAEQIAEIRRTRRNA